MVGVVDAVVEPVRHHSIPIDSEGNRCRRTGLRTDHDIVDAAALGLAVESGEGDLVSIVLGGRDLLVGVDDAGARLGELPVGLLTLDAVEVAREKVALDLGVTSKVLLDETEDQLGGLEAGLAALVVEMGVHCEHGDVGALVVEDADGDDADRGSVPALGRDRGRLGQPDGLLLLQRPDGRAVEDGRVLSGLLAVVSAHAVVGPLISLGGMRARVEAGQDVGDLVVQRLLETDEALWVQPAVVVELVDDVRRADAPWLLAGGGRGCCIADVMREDAEEQAA